MISTRLALSALLAVGALTGCTKDNEEPATSGNPTTTASEGGAGTPETIVGSPATALVLTGTDYAFAGEIAAPISAGEVTVTLENDGEEEHQATIVSLKPGRTMDDFGAVADDPTVLGEVVDVWGGPNAVLPGASNTATQHLAAGDYFFVCFIPSPDGVPHVAKGMVAPFTVEGDAGEPEETADDVIAMDEYDFGFGDDALISAGPFVFRNDGELIHETVVYAPAEGSTAEDVVEFFTGGAEPSGPPPIGAGAGIAPTNPGTSVRADLELDPGEYVFICFVPDAEDGAPHFAKGMIQVVSVE